MARLSHSLLGGWQLSGITNFATGSPFSVIYNAIDNAGVGNGDGSDSYAISSAILKLLRTR